MKKICFVDMPDSLSASCGDLSFYLFRQSSSGVEFETVLKGLTPEICRTRIDEAGVFFLNLPLSSLGFRILDLPFTDKEKIRKVIPLELEGMLLAGHGETVFDVIQMDGGKALVVFMDLSALKNIIKELEPLGIDPAVITCCDLRRAAGMSSGDLAGYLMEPVETGPDERLNALREEAMSFTINLRSGPLACTKGQEEIRKKLRVTAALALAAAVIINGFLIYRIVMFKKEASSVSAEIRSVYSGLFPEDRKIGDELYQMKSHIKTAKERADAFGGVRSLRLLREVSKNMVKGVVFTEISVGAEAVTMKGEAVSMERLGKAKEAVSLFIADVNISDVKNSAEGGFVFTLTGRQRL